MDPIDLLKHAEALLRSHKGAPKQIDLRRSISAAYYALFHCILRATADELIGSSAKARRSAAYALVYRGFEHSHMKAVCTDLSKAEIPSKFFDVFATKQLPPTFRETAGVFVSLQDARHLADYVPAHRFSKSDAKIAISNASLGFAHMRAGKGPFYRAFLLSMLLRVR
jgi:hypothetical protein